MRIAIYCPHYEDPGGVREVTRRLARGLVDGGDRVVLLARARHAGLGPLPDRDPDTGAPLWRTRVAPAPLRGSGWRATRQFVRRFPGGAWRLVRQLRAERPDVVATHCSKRHAPWVLALRAGVGVPIVVHLHNAAQTADGPESPGLTRLLLRCATRVIAVSEPVAAYARTILPSRADRVVCIPNGVEPGEFAGVAPMRRARPYVLGVGRLAAQKGFDLLLPAFASAGTDAELVLAGDGPDRDALVAEASRLGVADRVTLLGGVDRATVAALLCGAAVVAMPSRFEGHPLVALEAMQAGAPLVATDIPGMPASLRHGETGWLVPPDDIAALADALRTLLADPARARGLGAAAARAAADFLGWDAVTARVRAEYATAIAQTRS